MKRRHIAAVALGALWLTVTLSSCTSSAHPVTSSSGPPTPSPSGTATAIQTGCNPPSPITVGSFGPEVRGTGHGAGLYGLIQVATPLPVRVGEAVKIVWRMTGAGPLRLSATGPSATSEALQWGPEAHATSSYQRPGQEWGAGYLFPAAGCWHLEAQRTDGSADVWLRVIAR